MTVDRLDRLERLRLALIAAVDAFIDDEIADLDAAADADQAATTIPARVAILIEEYDRRFDAIMDGFRFGTMTLDEARAALRELCGLPRR